MNEELTNQILAGWGQKEARNAHPLPIPLGSTFVIKGWGNEEILCNNTEFCGKVLRFHAGAQFSMHLHVKKREVFWIQRGKIRLTSIDTINATKLEWEYGTGSVIEIPRLCPHQITALEETDVVEFSTHHEDSDSLRFLPGDSQRGNEAEKTTPDSP